MPKTAERLSSPSDLVAIARAAHRVGDRALLASARRLLKSQFGIVIRFEDVNDPEHVADEVGA